MLIMEKLSFTCTPLLLRKVIIGDAFKELEHNDKAQYVPYKMQKYVVSIIF